MGDLREQAAIADMHCIVTENGDYGQQISAVLRSGKKMEFDFGKLFGPPRTLSGYLQTALSASAPNGAPPLRSSM